MRTCDVLVYVGEGMWEKVGEGTTGVRSDTIYWVLMVLCPFWPSMSDETI